MGKVALIDGDPLVYISAFAAEKSTYATPDGTVFATPAPARKHCDTLGCPHTDIERQVEAEPKSHVLRLVKVMLERTMDRTGATSHEVWLSGNTIPTFRDTTATILPYKGNRASYKPFHYNTVRDYLINRWDAEVSHGIEADDCLGIRMCSGGNKDVICTIDKDLDMIPGMHYNYQKDDFHSVSQRRAYYSFYRQLLTGDKVDNIPGLYNVGPKTADATLAGCMTEEDMFWKVLQCYSDAPEYAGFAYDAFLENGVLLWIMREVGERWKPKW
jgi:hypothetical protein